MKKIILGTFHSRPGAETLIHHLRDDLHVPKDDISCIWRDENGETYEVIADEEGIQEELTPVVKTGSVVGGTLGAVMGGTLLLGALPIITPVFASSTYVLIAGVAASALGLISVGGLIGAIMGGLIASLFQKQASLDGEEEGTEIERKRNEVLVVAHARDEREVGKAFTFYGASGVSVYTPTLT